MFLVACGLYHNNSNNNRKVKENKGKDGLHKQTRKIYSLIQQREREEGGLKWVFTGSLNGRLRT
jgi:hypothetical protein